MSSTSGKRPSGWLRDQRTCRGGCDRGRKSRIQGRQHEQRENCRSHQTAKNHNSRRVKNLQSGDVAQRDKGENDRAGCDGACDDRSQALFHPSQDRIAATPRILLFEILEAPDLDDPVARSKAENREKSQERAEREHPAAERDRKSTRLNSSHSQISYAVFCLKKKKKEISDTD